MHDSNAQRRRWWQVPIGNLLLPVAAWAAIHTFAAAELNPTTGAEGLFLALWAGVMIAVLSALSPPPKLEAAGAAILAVLAVWGIYAVPTRGAAVGLILVAGLSIASWRRLADEWPRPSWASLFQIALGLQILFGSRMFLHLDWERALIDLLALPAVGALAAWFIAARQPSAALVGGALVVLQQGGWTPMGVLVLFVAAIAVHTAGIAIDRSSIRLYVVLAAAAIGVLAISALQSARWSILIAMMMTVYVPRWRRVRPGILIAVAGVAVLLIVGPMPAWREALDTAWWFAVLLPGALFMEPSRQAEGLVTLGLSMLALVYVPPEYVLPAALVFIAISLRGRGHIAQIQGSWASVWLGIAALCSSYPWLRPHPLPAAGRLLGLAPHPVPAAIVLTVAAALVLVWPRIRRLPAARHWPVGTGVVVGAVVALMISMPPAVGAERELAPEVLNVQHSSWSMEWRSPVTTRHIVLDTYLSNSASLSAGTPVADIDLETTSGPRSFALRAGIDTGEWAAERPDVAAQPGFKAPEAWLSWVAPDRSFFARRYRARFTLDPAAKVERLSIHLSAAIPKDVSVTLWHLELEP